MSELWNQAESKVIELTETNNNLIAALESNKEDTENIATLFGGLNEDYNNLLLQISSLELQVKAKKQAVTIGYITAGGMTLAGIGLWIAGDAVNNDYMKSAGIGLAFGGGIPLISISVTDLISRIKKK